MKTQTKDKMKKVTLVAAAAIVIVVGCGQDILVDNGSKNNGGIDDKAIQFGLSLTDAMTKASKAPGNSFVEGDAFAVDAFQTTGGSTMRLFNKQTVSFDGTEWSYSPIRYWNIGSMYDFYAMYPSSQSYLFVEDTKHYIINNFTVADKAADQVDLMIAQQKVNASPFNEIDFVFNHLLSNVNFYLKASNNMNLFKIESIEIVSFNVSGLKSKGSFMQTGWDSNDVALGSWDVDDASAYNMPEAKGMKTVTETTGIVTDLLMMPQTISDDAVITVSYKINYSDGTSSLFNKSTKLANIAGKRNGTDDVEIAKWDIRNRYNYYLTVNPSTNENGGDTGKPNGSITSDDNDEERPSGVDIVTVDTDDDGEPDEYWVDENRDGTPDYPLVWDDPNGDGTEELYPDHDGDGIPDYRDDDDPHLGDNDGDGTPDDLWIDTDGDGEADAEVTRKPEVKDPVIPESVVEPVPYVDYNGGVNEYKFAESYLMGPDNRGDYWIDVDGNGTQDILVVWKDIDGDDLLEGIADRNEDCLATADDNYDGDAKDYLGGYNLFDAVLVYVNGEWKELEKKVNGQIDSDIPTNPEEYPTQELPQIDFNGGVDGYDTPSAWIVGPDENGDYMIDTDGDGKGDVAIIWQDIDGDGKLEAVADKDGDGKLTEADTYDGDGKDYNGNDNQFDVIKAYDKESDSYVELEREVVIQNPVIPEYKLAVEFSAVVEDWVDEYNSDIVITK